MRSVIVHLQNATEAEVAAFLSSRYVPSSNSAWAMPNADAPLLYIDIYRDINIEFEVEDWYALVEALGGEPSVSVVADVSGRHPGDETVREFTCTLLAAFGGVAQDDYTPHYWTRQEIEVGNLADGCPFFDYVGRHGKHIK